MYLKVPSLVEGPPAEMFQNLCYDFFDFDCEFHDRGLISVLIFLLQIAFRTEREASLFGEIEGQSMLVL